MESYLRLFPILLTFVLTACVNINPTYTRPDESIIPQSWLGISETVARDDATLSIWWHQFNDPILNELIRLGLSANTDIATARAQLRVSRSQRDLSHAALWPSISVSATTSRNEATEQVSNVNVVSDSYNAGFDASWEPDIFGENRLTVTAADADVQTNEELLRDVRITLIAEIARNYVELRIVERRLKIAQSNVAAQEELYQLTRWRSEAGLVSELDELQARSLLEQTRATLFSFNETLVSSRYRLAVLLAESPGTMDEFLAETGEIPVIQDEITAGIPADMLRQRPDVRTAERRLAAQAARLGEAEAARFPSFNLSGSLGLRASDIGSLITGDALNNSLLAGISAPLFDAGRIRANIQIQDALLEQFLLAYRTAVLNALEEVENAFNSLSSIREQQDRLVQASNAAGEALELSQQQYSVGLEDFQVVLDNQRTMLTLEDQLATLEGEHVTTLIQLYKALGGGWTYDEI